MSRTDSLSVFADVYVLIDIPLDRLPHSPEMNALVAEVARRTGERQSAQRCWHELVNLRKNGRLPRLRRQPS